jgi:hypothetical protein
MFRIRIPNSEDLKKNQRLDTKVFSRKVPPVPSRPSLCTPLARDFFTDVHLFCPAGKYSGDGLKFKDLRKSTLKFAIICAFDCSMQARGLDEGVRNAETSLNLDLILSTLTWTR